MRFQSKSQHQNSSTDDKHSFQENEVSNSECDSQNKSKRMNKKIKKYSLRNKSGNWGSGRPSKSKKTIEDQQQNQQLIESTLQNQWFGRDISMRIIIYLCKMGNMIFKVITGIPASKIKQEFMKVDSNTHQYKKKYTNQLKKDLKDKSSQILEHLAYPEDTTYMFLGKNVNSQDRLLINNISEESKCALEIVIKYLSPEFVKTYKLIVREYFKNYQAYDENYLIDIVVKELIDNYQDHKMIFDRQLIYELTKHDFTLINQIESNPSLAQFHLCQNSSISELNFYSNTFNDEQKEIKQTSSWIKQFLRGFYKILDSCHPNA